MGKNKLTIWMQAAASFASPVAPGACSLVLASSMVGLALNARLLVRATPGDLTLAVAIS